MTEDSPEAAECRADAVKRLNAIALKATSDYCAAIAEGDIQKSEDDMKIIRIMEDAKDMVQDAPFYEIANILKYYSERIDEL